MTECEREGIVKQMFPDWTEHLNDGKVLDNILEELNRCGARSASCKHSWEQRKAADAKKLQSAGRDSSERKVTLPYLTIPGVRVS